ncbi:MAG: hypothetical protein K6G26_10410, partial [Lachnospiraceae bacterium]|nr:hypothetical protein [Lachnospiraceae bacterium]
HVATIDLKDSKELTCCFNDGNNNWDSNNGKNYTFKAGKYTYFNGQIDEIKENVEDDKVVIYYTGCDTPYLHYSIRGAWTSVPGIQMEECNEVAGYTHKVEVNVQGNETMTCCFNDGNGNWDNNNGNDYVLSKGVYYYNNGSLSESK